MNIKNKKGITLTSLIIYVISFTILLGVISFLLLGFVKNTQKTQEIAQQIKTAERINSFMKKSIADANEINRKSLQGPFLNANEVPGFANSLRGKSWDDIVNGDNTRCLAISKTTKTSFKIGLYVAGLSNKTQSWENKLQEIGSSSLDFVKVNNNLWEVYGQVINPNGKNQRIYLGAINREPEFRLEKNGVHNGFLIRMFLVFDSPLNKVIEYDYAFASDWDFYGNWGQSGYVNGQKLDSDLDS